MRATVLPLLLLAAGCVQQLPPPPRPYVPPIAPPPHAPGSLWEPGRAANYSVIDVRARFPGDLLTVQIVEQAKGKKEGTTEATGESSISAKVDDFFGIPKSAVGFLPSGFNPESIVTAQTKRTSTGDAETSREDSLSASITVTVVQVESNGNLLIQGDKVVRVNREDQHIQLTGTVRPEDITPDNTVLSSRLADARISYFGQGTVSDKQKTPLVHSLFDKVWPF